MKKKCAYLLIAALSVSMLAGCGSKKSSSSSSKSEVTKGSKEKFLWRMFLKM
ncbi:MAG: hypothetical protein II919_03990 [Lachnospiraceae bacterium]|nr:hypothetical protein [Lachnospiraceae bacterium]